MGTPGGVQYSIVSYISEGVFFEVVQWRACPEPDLKDFGQDLQNCSVIRILLLGGQASEGVFAY